MLSFYVNPNSITFHALNYSEGWSDTKTLAVETSTNAAHGYSVYVYNTQDLSSAAYPGQAIPDFNATWENPLVWGGSDYGFGYSSNDPLVDQVDRFSNHTKYAAFTQLAPGKICADHTDTIDGSTGSVSDSYTIYYKVAASEEQSASNYQTYSIFTATANY